MTRGISGLATDIRIGKAKLTDGLLAHIEERLKQAGTVKIRVLKNATGPGDDVRSYARQIEARLGITVVDVRGNTIVVGKGGR